MNDFNFFKRVGDERLEINGNNDVLKKYGGTKTSWPHTTKVQPCGTPHKDQQREVNNIDLNIGDFFKNNM